MVGPAAGAAALAPRRVDEPVDLALATLDVRFDVLLGLRAQSARLLRGFGSRRREQLLGGGARGEQPLLALAPGVGGQALNLRLRLGDDQASTLLRVTHDVGGRGVDPRLINDLGAVRLGGGPDLVGLGTRPIKFGVRFAAALVRGSLRCLDVGLGAQPGTIDRRIRLQAPARDQSLGFVLHVGDRAFAILQALLEVADLLARAALAKPLAHQPQMAIDLVWIVAAADTPKVALDHEHRARVAFTASGHFLCVRRRAAESCLSIDEPREC